MSRAPEEEIGYLLKRLMHLFRHELEQRLREGATLSFANMVTLSGIAEEPGIAGAQLARRLMITAQSMAVLLRRLEADGSIERRRDPGNRRADRWYVLPAGLQRLQGARAAGSPVMTQMLSGLTGEEVSGLRGYLDRCVQSLDAAAQGTGKTAKAAR